MTWVQDDEKGYKKLVHRDGVLTGFVMIGDVERAGIYTALIRNKTPLCEIDYELVRQRPQLMAFSKEERQRATGRERRMNIDANGMHFQTLNERIRACTDAHIVIDKCLGSDTWPAVRAM